MVTETKPTALSAAQQAKLPVPDPTSLTTDNMLREVKHLKELMDGKLESAKKLNDQKFEAAERANALAEGFVEKRLDSLGEFRAAFNDLVSQQMPRVEAETRINALADKLESRLSDMSKKIDELRSFTSKAFLIGGISLLVSTISVLITLVTFLKLY